MRRCGIIDQPAREQNVERRFRHAPGVFEPKKLLRQYLNLCEPGFEQFEEAWSIRAPLGWDVKDPSAVASACVALLSDLFPATTGEMLHVDGGFHAVGA